MSIHRSVLALTVLTATTAFLVLRPAATAESGRPETIPGTTAPSTWTPWTAAEAVTALRFNQLAADLGLTVTELRQTAESPGPGFLAFSSPKPWGLYFAAPGGAFAGFTGGNLRHLGGLTLRWAGGEAVLDGFELRPAAADPFALELVDAAGETLFRVDHVHAFVDPGAKRLELNNMDVRIAPALAVRIGDSRLAGLTVASMSVHAAVEVPAGADLTAGACSNPNWPTDPGFDADVELLNLGQLQQSAREPGVRVAVTPSASLRNVGTADVPWYAPFDPPAPPYGNDQHPYLVWALYRVADGRLEQIGRSEVKHAFFTVNTACGCAGGHILWVACEDTYGVGTNESRQWLAPREEVTASTGVWERCGSHFDPDCDDDRDHGAGGHDPFEHRMVVAEPDLATAGADYYIEGWYVIRDDVDVFNTMGYRRVTPQLVGSVWTFALVTPLALGPVIDAWVDPADPGPRGANDRLSTPDGHLTAAVRALALGAAGWRYEYAVANHDYDRRVQRLQVPLPAGVVATAAGFSDGDGDPANDWPATVTAEAVSWQAPAGAAALDWGEQFAFYFEVPTPPVTAAVTLVPQEPGQGSQLAAELLAPAPAAIFADGFESGDTSAWTQGQ